MADQHAGKIENGTNRLVWAVCGTVCVLLLTILGGVLGYLCIKVSDQSAQIAGLTASFDAMRDILARLISRIP